MQGQILEADAAVKSGTILGDDGNRYGFSTADWRAADVPLAGMRVDFVPGEGSAAREIFPLPGGAAAAATMAIPVMAVPLQAQPMRPAPNNSQVLGWIGIACLVLGFVLPILIPTIAAFILGLIGADSAKRHKDTTGLVVSRIAWIGAVVTVVLGILFLLVALAFFWPLLVIFFDAAVQSQRDGQGTNALVMFLLR